MSENGSNSVGLDQDEDVPETLSDEGNGMYLQMNIKDIRDSASSNKNRESGMSSEIRKSKQLVVEQPKEIQKARFLSPTNATKPSDLGNEPANQARHVYHSP